MSPSTPQSGSSRHLPVMIETRRSLQLAAQQERALSVELRDPESEANAPELDLRAYLQILWKRRWTVLAAALIVFVTVLVGTLLMTPIYRATAVLKLDKDTIRVVDVGAMNSVGDNGDRDFYQTQYELLRSRTLMERVVSNMGLAASGELDRLLQSRGLWSNLLGRFSGDATARASAPGPGPGSASPLVVTAARQIALATDFMKSLSIEPVRNSSLVRVNYDSPDPAFSQRAANAIATAFIARNLEQHFDSSTYAKGYLEERLQELKLKLEDSERSLVGFAQQEQIVDVGEQSTGLSEQTLASLNAALGKAREDRIRTESLWRQAQASRGLILYGDLGKTSIIASLQENRGKLLAEYQDKLRLYKPDYPLMRQLKGQAEEIERQIAVEIDNIKAAIKAEYLGALEQERLLNEQMHLVRSDVLDLQKRSIQYNIYKREVDTNRQLYDGLLQRYKEVGLAGGVTSNNISIVDQATNGGKFKPDLKSNLRWGALLGLLFGVLLALGIEHLDDTLKVPEDLEKHLGIAVLGVIPLLRKTTPQQAWQVQNSAFVEAYRSLRTALQFSTANGAPKSILITSATPNEGKSTTAVALARNFAQMGMSVLLIDADLRNPTLHKTFGLHNHHGLSNLLAGAARPDAVIRTTPDKGLMVMTSGPLPPNPAELLAGSKMLSLLTVAGVKFDRIVIDGPPVLGLADVPILSNVARGTLLVVEAAETRISVANNAVKRLRLSQAFIIGGVLTKYESPHAGYGYGYGYGYGASKYYGGPDRLPVKSGLG